MIESERNFCSIEFGDGLRKSLSKYHDESVS